MGEWVPDKDTTDSFNRDACVRADAGILILRADCATPARHSDEEARASPFALRPLAE